MVKKAIVLSILVFAVGCSSHHLGYSKSEWNAFSEEDKITIEQEFSQVLKAKNDAVFGDSIEKAIEDSDRRFIGDYFTSHKLGY